MFGNLEMIRMAAGLARHATDRQNVVARNIANADTPGFRTQDLAPFSELYENAAAGGLRATRPGHLALAGGAREASLVTVPGESSPNGNTVSLEAEMMRSAEVRHEYDVATSIYKTSLDILRTSLGRGR